MPNVLISNIPSKRLELLKEYLYIYPVISKSFAYKEKEDLRHK